MPCRIAARRPGEGRRPQRWLVPHQASEHRSIPSLKYTVVSSFSLLATFRQCDADPSFHFNADLAYATDVFFKNFYFLHRFSMTFWCIDL